VTVQLNTRGYADSPYCEHCPCSENGKPVKPVPAFGGTGGLCIVGEAPGCFPKGTPILTSLGFRSIETLVEHCPVTGGSGTDVLVQKPFARQYKGKLYTIQICGGWRVSMTDEHPVYVYPLKSSHTSHSRRRLMGEGFWLPANALSREFAVFIPWPKLIGQQIILDLVTFPTRRLACWPSSNIPDRLVLTPEIAFLLGAYAGDGSYGSGVVQFHLSRGYKERYVLPRLLKTLRQDFRIEPIIHYRGKNNIKVCVNSTRLGRYLQYILGTGCTKKRVPVFMFRAPLMVRSQFMLGWYQTDGNHLRDDKRNKKIATVSQQGALDLVALFLSCRIYPNHRIEQPSKGSKGKLPCHYVGIRNADARQLEWSIDLHNRKTRAVHTVTKEGVFVPISKIEKRSWSGQVYNIETPTHDYLVPFRVHNSTERDQGFPFVGPSGKVVTRALRKGGIDKGYVFICNALLCQRPVSEEDFAQAVDCCRQRLQNDLMLAQPTAICAVGGTAMRALELPVTTVSLARGTVQFSPIFPNVPVIGSIHPAALLRGGAGEMAAGGKQKMNVEAQALFLFADIKKAHLVATSQVDAVWSDDIQVVHEAADVLPAIEALFADVYAEGLLGLDLEWTCKDSKNALDALGAEAHRAQITWVGLGCSKRAVSFKWDALVEAGAFERLQDFMEDENLPKLMHNKQADIAVWEAQVGPIKGRRLDCYIDSETEFLTRAGWQRYCNIGKSDWLATLDSLGRLEWQHYTARMAQRFTGAAFEFETNHTRAVVTPNHNMWCRPMRRTSKSWRGSMLEPWQLIKAKDLLVANTDTFEVRRACAADERVQSAHDHPFREWSDAGKPWLELIGIWLTDGSLGVRKTVAGFTAGSLQLHQAINGRAIPLLEKLERAFGMPWSTSRHKEPWRAHNATEKTWRLNSKRWASLFWQLFGRYSKERHLADFVWDLDRSERIRLLHAMFLGDGHTLKKTFRYNTFSARLADDVQALCLSVGWPATCQGDSGGFHVSIRRGDAPICQIRARIRKNLGRYQTHNNGSVVLRSFTNAHQVCFSVPNQRLITRSNGRPAFHGNSMLAHHAVCPGIDHDLQQVASQYLCIPPWKVEHAKKAAEHAEQRKLDAKAEKAAEREKIKTEKKAVHDAENARKKLEAAEKKALRKADHEARNLSKKVEKAQKKAGKKAASAASAEQLALLLGGDMAAEVVGDILDPPEPFEHEREDGDLHDEEGF
jgi:uracil-DNA glycosylase family 4